MGKALYSAFFTGTTGNSFAIFYIGDGILFGLDAGLATYTGSYTQAGPDAPLVGAIELHAPANTPLITGQPPGGTQTINIPLTLPANFANGSVVRIETPMGPVNAIFRKGQDIHE